MEKKNLMSFKNPLQIILYVTLVFLFTGIFWVLISGKSLIGFIILGLGIVGLIYLGIYRKKEILASIKEIDWKKISIKFYYILIVIAVVSLINIIANKRFLRKDFTAGRQFTLSGHSKTLLKELEKNKKDIKMLFFRTPGYLTGTVEDLLKEYKARCSVLSIEFISPEKDPLRAKDYEIRSIGVPYGGGRLYGTLIILCSGLKESVDVIKMDFRQAGGQHQPYIDIKENLEKEISSALLQMNKAKKKVYFLMGHGEVDLDDEQDTGWLQAKGLIAGENYGVDKIYLASIGKIPNDCDVLIIGAPRKNFLEKEYDILNKYLEEGGRILVMLEPFASMNINKFLNKWGVKKSGKLVLDPASCYFFQANLPVVSEYDPHKITEKLKYTSTVFPAAAPITIMDESPEGVDVQGIIKTSSDSWAETDIHNQEMGFDKNVDDEGPINIFAVISKKIDEEREARMVVIGDSDFACNYYIRMMGNMDLLLNTLNWLAGKEEMVGIRSKPVDRREMFLTVINLKFILYFCIIILPVLVIISGVVVWLRRR